MSHIIAAEMAANVWKVLVESGATVNAGDELCILESMKMEIPVLSDITGTVTQVHIAEGQSVQQGGALVTIE